MVKDPEHNNPEGVEKIKPESKASAVSTKPFIDVHDQSENEKDTEAKFSAENALYERGTYNVIPIHCVCTLLHHN